MVWRRGAQQTWGDTQSLRRGEASQANERASSSARVSNTTAVSMGRWHPLRISLSETTPVGHGARDDAKDLRFLVRAGSGGATASYSGFIWPSEGYTIVFVARTVYLLTFGAAKNGGGSIQVTARGLQVVVRLASDTSDRKLT